LKTPFQEPIWALKYSKNFEILASGDTLGNLVIFETLNSKEKGKI
jgi:hypothetical protein